ncbi:hypothetical protein L798_09952 [Zootermopsis nevadensis]|uniref:Uncharacterized protein n=1 Tax=Zootermopsis nevadensis TaxID=136037 RepID=A0A067R139_ZOONE|nr:hypothetical protein L798_09952 [Zootermopsis nevadensis]
MVKPKVVRHNPQGVKRILDVSGPSGRRTKTKVTTKTDKDKLIDKSMKMKKQAQHTLRSPLSTDFENSSSEISDTEITSTWQQGQVLASVDPSKHPEGARVTATSPIAGPSGTQNLVVEAEVHCSQGGTKTDKVSAQKSTDSATASSELLNPDEIVEGDDFIVITSKKKLERATPKPAITEEAIHAELPSSPTPETRDSGKTGHTNNQYLNVPRAKIPPVVIHHHYEGDMTRLNKDFHAKFQRLGFISHRLKSGIACQTSTYKDYLNLQTFLKDNKVPFNLLSSNDSKPFKVVIKGIPPTTPLKPSKTN